MRKALALAVFSGFLLTGCQVSSECPSKDSLKTTLKDFIPGQFEIESVQPLKEMPSVCEVVLKVGAQPIIFYTNKDGKYVLAGNLIDIANRQNLTTARQQELMRLSQELYPLPIHPQAFGKSVALLCDKKGWQEYKSGYTSGSQCEDGKKKIESNLLLAERYGINGTPTFIGMNGKTHVGLPTEQDLDKLTN